MLQVHKNLYIGCTLLDIRHCSWSTHKVITWTGQFGMKQRDNKGKCFELLSSMAIWYGTMRYTVDLQQYWGPHSFPVGDTLCITCKLPKSSRSLYFLRARMSVGLTSRLSGRPKPDETKHETIHFRESSQLKTKTYCHHLQRGQCLINISVVSLR